MAFPLEGLAMDPGTVCPLRCPLPASSLWLLAIRSPSFPLTCPPWAWASWLASRVSADEAAYLYHQVAAFLPQTRPALPW